MDFFEAQDRAKRRSQRLVVLFALAVLGTIAASYLAAVVLVGQTRDYGEHGDAPASLVWWDPQLFGTIAAITVLVVGLSSLFKWSQMRRGGAAIAEMVGGRRIDPQTTDLRERRLLNVVEEMAIASGVPVPAVFILENEPGINAFAAGLTTSDAAVAVTRGTMEKLSRDELQGVIAHEFSHILNGDMRLNVKLTAIVFGILVIGLLGRGVLRSLMYGRVRGGGGRNNKGGGVALVVAVGIALLIIGYFGYFFGRLIQAAVSRQREFLADASAVQFTRNPLGIGGALKKIGGYALGSTMVDNRTAEIGHFFFAQGFRSSFGGLWATHPPLDQRIRAVEPRWDGKLFEPPAIVDVERESFRSQPERRAAPGAARIPFPAAIIAAGIGALAEQHFQQAQDLLGQIPAELREAAHDPRRVAPLVYALLLSASGEASHDAQVTALHRHASAEEAAEASRLAAATRDLAAAARLPLLQLSAATLRSFDRAQLDRLTSTLDEMMHADARISVFEFALQKVLVHQLDLLQQPTQGVQFHSFQAVSADIAAVLTTLARAGAGEAPEPLQAAFAQGAAQLPLLPGLRPISEADPSFERLDTALDRLARSSLPIKRRVLVAAAHVIGADGTVTVEEGELYRAVAMTLDCPLPMLNG